MSSPPKTPDAPDAMLATPDPPRDDRRMRRRRAIKIGTIATAALLFGVGYLAARHYIALMLYNTGGWFVGWSAGNPQESDHHAISAPETYFHEPIRDADLGQLPFIYGLRSLSFDRADGLTDRGLATIGRLTWIEKLNLSRNTFRSYGSPDPTIHGPLVSDANLGLLKGLEGMRELWLDGASITDASIDIILGYEKLEFVDLSRTGITDAGFERLKALPNLKTIGLEGSKVSCAARERFAQDRSAQERPVSVDISGCEQTSGGSGSR